jgi:hypothetical protein
MAPMKVSNHNAHHLTQDAGVGMPGMDLFQHVVDVDELVFSLLHFLLCSFWNRHSELFRFSWLRHQFYLAPYQVILKQFY